MGLRQDPKLDYKASATQLSWLKFRRSRLLTQFHKLTTATSINQEKADFPCCQEFQFTKHTPGVLSVSIKSLLENADPLQFVQILDVSN